jgi:hypothetical protein
MRAMHFGPASASADCEEVGGEHEHDVARIDGASKIGFWRLDVAGKLGNVAVLAPTDEALPSR